MKRLAFAMVVGVSLGGCGVEEQPHEPLHDPSVGATVSKSKYTILVVYGPYADQGAGLAYNRYHADVVQVTDAWVVFHDKTLDANVRVPATQTTVIGGTEPILPYIKAGP